MKKCKVCNKANARVNGNYCYSCFQNLKTKGYTVSKKDMKREIKDKQGNFIQMYFDELLNRIVVKIKFGNVLMSNHFTSRNKADEFWNKMVKKYNFKDNK